jgi:para-aminobenzoate synthetase component 1
LSRSVDGMPDMAFGFYDVAVVCDNLEKKVWLTACGGSKDECRRLLGGLKVRLGRKPAVDVRPIGELSIVSNFTRDGYMDAVRGVKAYIHEGDVYQVNLSQRFSARVELDAWGLYKRLRTVNPAPFSAYLGFGGWNVMCSSPERFLKVGGGIVETKPIKGTRPRSADGEADRRLGSELLASGKDKAEHVMIVDLERNDLGKVCEYGSVAVSEFEMLESYPTVHHMVSTVRGRLRDGVGLVDCIRACFPGGSITGAPKVRAMEIINELEPDGRGLYTGSIGYLGFDGRMDLNIVIRTMFYCGGTLSFNVGGGIVADSDPDGEYDETIDKARALFESLGVESHHMKICVNGEIREEEEKTISPLDYGFLYGFGLFETMRAEKGRVRLLGRHLGRLRGSAEEIGIPLPYTDAEIEGMIASTLEGNRLADAYVRVTLTRGFGEPRLSFPKDVKPTLTVLVRMLPKAAPPARLAVSKKHGVYSKDIRARIKSTNYLVNALAKEEANRLGVDDVILQIGRASCRERV